MKFSNHNDTKRGFETRSIHSGQEIDPTTGSVITPIYVTSTFAQESPGKHKGYEYSRTKNPTRSAYETCIADLEGARFGFAFASGMAAADAILSLLESGDEVVAMDDLYGGTRRLFQDLRKKTSNLKFRFEDFSTESSFEKVISSKTKMIWIESPTNPTLKLVDFDKLSNLEKNIITVVDNTFASPWIQRPIERGVDIVMHSATKYLNGHSDMVGGVAVTDSEYFSDKLGYIQNASGAIQGPFDSFLALRGLKTLSLRMERHCSNALKIARWLENHRKIDKVFYPGLESFKQYELAKKQMNGFGGIISANINSDISEVINILKSFRIFTLAESLGGVESLIEHPASMTHASIPKDVREKLGIDDGLIRLSVGIESVDDLISDLQQALE